MVLLKAVSDPKFSVEPMDVFWVGVERVQKSSIAVVYTKVDAPPKKVAKIDTFQSLEKIQSGWPGLKLPVPL